MNTKLNNTSPSAPSSDELYQYLFQQPLTSALLQVIPEALLIVNRQMQVIYANQAARELFLFSNTQCLRLVEVTRNKAVYDCFTQALDQPQLIEKHLELTVTRHEYTPKSVYARLQSIVNSEDSLNSLPKVIGVVGTFFDNTKLEALERMRREFFANLSHELRTPLTVIQNYTETMLSGGLEDQENNVQFIEIIAKHARRMQNLAKDISDLAAIESGKVTLQPQQIHLARLVKEIFDLLQDAAQQRQVSLMLEINANLQLRTDAKALEQIIFNLVQNGINFNHPQGSVTVSASSTDSCHIITVKDTGIGLEAKHIARIFERLYRVDESRSRREGGTGLGLAIVKHLVQQLHGSIKVESLPGKGSSFIIFLPLA
jgi:two-component system phosphate regulon sensor histidine kinase PhoR